MTTGKGLPEMNKQQSDKTDREDDFSSIADEQDPGLLAEFWDFLIHNKKWWLTPIILVLLLMGLLVMLSGTAAAPFIYTLW
ncbi:MAG: DUF5989 family protein [Planctomycetota bacterium]